MTLTIELPDDIYEAVRIEAEAYGDTAKTRVERVIEQLHRHRATTIRADAHKRLDDCPPDEVRTVSESLLAS